jgi:hypothetical protein
VVASLTSDPRQSLTAGLKRVNNNTLHYLIRGLMQVWVNRGALAFYAAAEFVDTVDTAKGCLFFCLLYQSTTPLRLDV